MNNKKTYLEIFKENKEIIVLIPTLLGGLYQILNLVILVGMPYVRYFSVSQVIPDGLLISLVFFWIYIAYKLIFSFYKQFNPNQENITQYSCFYHIFYIIFFCSLGISGLYYAYHIGDFSSFQKVLCRYSIYAIFTLLFWHGFKHFLSVTKLDIWVVTKINNMDKDFKGFLLSLLVIAILGVMIRVVPNEIKVINEIFIKVNNFENYSAFSENIKKKYDMKSEPILLYINKEYAFFKIPDKDDKILVLDSKGITEIKK